MKEILLTRGYVTIVDDDDYELMALHKWHANVQNRSNGSTLVYAERFRTSDKKMLRMHREIMLAQKGQVLDHINGNGLDNRKKNLRFVSNAENTYNRAKQATRRGRSVSSRYKGVHWNRIVCQWEAKIYKGGVEKSIGYFDSAINAAVAYNIWAVMLFGEHAKLNDIEVKR